MTFAKKSCRRDLTRHTSKVLASGGLTLALALPSVCAQELLHSETGQSSEATTLPAVTITATNPELTTEGSNSYTTQQTSAATRLPLSLRETPQAVSVITRQRIEDQQLDTVQEALENSTGIVPLTIDSERVSFYSRGFAVDSFQYDGIPTTFVNGASFLDTAFYDRIEIVRGATGLLTGTGNPSASINLVRKKPTRQFSATASVSAGSWDNYRSMLDVSTPLSEDGRVRGRVVAVGQDRHSYLDRYQQQKQAFLGTVEIDLTEDTMLSLGYDYQNIKPRGITWGGVPLWFSDGTPTHWSRSKSLASDWSRWDNRLENAFVSVEHWFDNGWKLNAAFNNQRSKSDAQLFSALGYPDRETGAGMLPVAIANSLPSRQNNFDAMVSGPVELWGRQHELVFGLMTSRRHADDYNSGFVFSADSLPNVYDWEGQYPRPDFGANGYTNIHTSVQQSGAYGAVRLSLTDPLKLILGGRFTNYKLDQAGAGTSSHYKKSAEFTPYAGIVYDLNETYSAYASYTEIFNPQTIYKDRNNQALRPITGKNFEIGLKGEYLDGLLNASVALFETRTDNLAQSENYALPNGTWAYYTADGAKSRGVELDLQGELSNGWNVYGGATYYSIFDSSGKRLSPQVPHATARLFSTYRLPGEWSKLTVGGGLNWQGRTYLDAQAPYGPVNVEQKSYALLSLMTKYRMTDSVEAMLSINNLTDKRHTIMNGYFNQVIYGAPRNFMLTLNYKL